MKFYALEYDLSEDSPEARILWETETTSITETMKLVNQKIGFEYEVVSEAEILEEAQKLYDVEALLN